MSADILLAIDQGTTSTRALLFDADGRLRGAPAQKELAQHFPAPGQVEHDPREIRDATVEVCRRVLAEHGLAATDLAGIGITNQRETVVVWDRATGEPLHRAIVWQDRRTAKTCARLRAAGAGDLVQERTGLLLDPYFSATKIAWILDHVPGARRRAADGELAAGTIDTWLLWQLTGGAVHATDATNASRTALHDIHRQRWDDELCALFDVPPSLLPEVRDGAADFGETAPDLLGAPVPLRGVAGDQQSAAIGQACWAPGSSKCTYGTGAFALLNTGRDAPRSKHRLLTTVAYRLDGEARYAMEGSIFSAGSTMQWLRDGLGLFRDAKESEAMARRADAARGDGAAADDAATAAGVHLVPAFTGLGAPHWDADARGALLGLTRDTTADDVVRAGLEAVAFQTAELLDAMEADGSPRPDALRVDGGMAANGWLMQRLADQLGLPVERPVVLETTALGAALLASRALGLCPTTEELAARWTLDRRFEPAMSADERAARRAAWDAAVGRVRTSD